MRALVAALLLATCGMHPALAQEVKCYEVVEFKKHMDKAGNERVFSGLVLDHSHILEVWVTPTGEWSAFVTTPDNVTCQASYGEHYVGPPPNA